MIAHNNCHGTRIDKKPSVSHALPRSALLLLAVSMLSCSASHQDGADADLDCRHAQAACADGFQCLESNGAWACTRITEIPSYEQERCLCDNAFEVCEAAGASDATACACDLDCISSGHTEACLDDGYCDSQCRSGLDPDC